MYVKQLNGKNMVTVEIKKIAPKLLKPGSLVLDVRKDDEVKEKSLDMPFLHEDSLTINVGDFIKKHKLDKNKTLNILCKTGQRAMEVAKKFFEIGYKNVQVIEGGIEQAEKEGLKIKIGK